MTFAESFDILGLSQDAGLEDVKRMYRKKAMQLHPDINKSATADDEFIRLKQAYEKAKYYINNKDNLHSILFNAYAQQATKQHHRRTAGAKMHARAAYQQSAAYGSAEGIVVNLGAYSALFKEKKYYRLLLTWFASLVLSLTLIVDVYAPLQKQSELVVAVREKHYSNKHSLEQKIDYKIQSEHHFFSLSDTLMPYLKDAFVVVLYKSVVFERIKKVVVIKRDYRKAHIEYFNKDSLFPYFIGMLLFSFAGIAVRTKYVKLCLYFQYYSKYVLPFLLFLLPLYIAFF